MLLIILFLILGIGLLFLGVYLDDNTNFEISTVFSFIGSAISIITFFIIIGMCIINNIDARSLTSQYLVEQETIEYKVNNLNKFIFNYEEVVNDINNWNKEIASGQIRHESLWFNWLYPIDYSQFKTFKLE